MWHTRPTPDTQMDVCLSGSVSICGYSMRVAVCIRQYAYMFPHTHAPAYVSRVGREGVLLSSGPLHFVLLSMRRGLLTSDLRLIVYIGPFFTFLPTTCSRCCKQLHWLNFPVACRAQLLGLDAIVGKWTATGIISLFCFLGQEFFGSCFWSDISDLAGKS